MIYQNDSHHRPKLLASTYVSVESGCHVQPESSMAWRVFQSWYLYVLHLGACGLLVGSMIRWVDQQNFQTGSPPDSFLHVESWLYQTQVTGLLSVALMLIRLVSGACTGLLTWRAIYVLLEKQGITLVQLTRLNNWRLPTVFRAGSKRAVLWSLWTILVVVLLWPSSLATPLATSAVAWVPSVKIASEASQMQVSAMSQNAEKADWKCWLYGECLTILGTKGAILTGKAPDYVLDTAASKFRRHFSSFDGGIEEGSMMDIVAPFFNVELRWINATSTNRSKLVYTPEYTDVSKTSFNNRGAGAVTVIRDTKWDPETSAPQSPQIVTGRKTIIAVKILTINKGDTLPDGTLGEEKSPCPSHMPAFGTLPAVKPYSIPYTWNDANQTWAGRDCFLMAEATITAGEFAGRDCVVNATGLGNYYATCVAPDLTTKTARPSWFSGPALDFLSETLKYTIMLNFTGAWMERRPQQQQQGTEFDLNAYATGALRLGYDAAWSQMIMTLVKPSEAEPVQVRQAQPVVRAVLNRPRLYLWLGLNGLVGVSALLVAWAQSRTTVAVPVRDTTLAPLLMDMSALTHTGTVSGLCNAGSLRKEDKKLPPMIWMNSKAPSLVDASHIAGGVDEGCRRRVVFATDLKG
ncbi:hypothetical protein PG989_015776 [Apiospora arundinis]